MPRIPGCNKLFQRYFVPWYDEDDLQRLEIGSRTKATARPDVVQFPDLKEMAGSAFSPLNQKDQRRCIRHLDKTMLHAAIEDFREYVDRPLPVDLSWIEAIDDLYDTGAIAALIADSDPAEDGNPYFITCIEIGVVIAAAMRSVVPELEWIPESPYWESALWHRKTATVIRPIHWAIKKLSGYGWNDGLACKAMCALAPLQRKRKTKRAKR